MFKYSQNHYEKGNPLNLKNGIEAKKIDIIQST